MSHGKGVREGAVIGVGMKGSEGMCLREGERRCAEWRMLVW